MLTLANGKQVAFLPCLKVRTYSLNVYYGVELIPNCFQSIFSFDCVTRVVFNTARVFNRDLSKWDVSAVSTVSSTAMKYSTFFYMKPMSCSRLSFSNLFPIRFLNPRFESS